MRISLLEALGSQALLAETLLYCCNMDISNWCNSGSNTIQLGQCCDEIGSVNSPSTTRSSKMMWKVLWMKLKKERRKMFESPAPVQLSYDPYTYPQNFDQGIAWDEPDNLSRSFSTRFADPSRMTLRKQQCKGR